MGSSGVTVDVYDVLRYLGQETHIILQSNAIPKKVLEVTLSPVDAFLDRDIPTQVPEFIQNKSEDTNIVHAGSAVDKGANGTRCDDCAIKPQAEYSDTGRVQIFVLTISVRNDQYLSG